MHTNNIYEYFQKAFTYYNKELFNDELSEVILTITRKKDVGGYFAHDSWFNEKDEIIHEIAINPDFFGNSSMMQILSVFAHEMCHLWRHECVEKKNRAGFHDKIWVGKMREIGLIPVSNDKGKDDGTGRKVSHHIAKDGIFFNKTSCFKGLLNYKTNNRLRLGIEVIKTGEEDKIVVEKVVFDEEEIEELMKTPTGENVDYETPIPEKKPRKPTIKKVKYKCSCDEPNEISGKENLRIICSDCNKEYHC